MSQPLRIGTRGSPLALWQARYIQGLLHSRHPDLEMELVTIRTAAEKFPDATFREIGVGVFTREIDQAVLDGRVDFAVHSLKDQPSELPPGLILAAVPPRESPHDVWISAAGTPLGDLPRGATVGTSSPRRQAQILHRRPDLRIVPMRGNVATRLAKVRELDPGGTILAQAGLRRLGQEACITEPIPTDWIVPAVGQGAIAVVAREDRREVNEILGVIDDRPTRIRVEAERGFLRTLRGGCQVPAGALATLDDETGTIDLEGVISSHDGARLVRGREQGHPDEAVDVGCRLAASLLDGGGQAILEEIRREGDHHE